MISTSKRCIVVGTLALLGGLGTLTTPAAAQACQPEVVASFGGTARDVDAANGMGYMVKGQDLVIADFIEVFVPFDPKVRGGDGFFEVQLTEIGRVRSSGLPLAVEVRGNLAYVAFDGGLEIFDVTDPAAPFALGSYATAGRGTDIAVEGSLVVLTDTTGLTIIDAANLAAPTLFGFAPFANPPVAVEINDGLIYVITDSPVPFESGLFVMDASNPQSIQEIGVLNFEFAPRDLDVSGAFAYITDAEGMQVVAVINPAAPVALGTKMGFGPATSIEVAGAFAYIGTEDQGVLVMDLADPSNPFIANDTGFFGLRAVSGIAFDGQDLYYTDDSIGLSFEEFFPSSPRGLAGNPFILTELGGATEVALEGNRAYLLDPAGIRILDITDPLSPVELGVAVNQSFDQARGLAVENGFAYTTLGEFGLAIFDLRDPEFPFQIGQFFINGLPDLVRGTGFFFPFEANDITVSGGVAYVTGQSSDFVTEVYGTSVIAVIDPFNPILMGQNFEPAVPVTRIAFGDGFAYLAESLAISALDVANPTTPFRADDVSTGSPVDIAYQSDVAFIVDEGFGFLAFDATNPYALSLLGAQSLATGGPPVALAVEGDRVVVVQEETTLRVINIADPEIPATIGQLSVPSDGRGVAYKDGYAFIADAERGLVVVDTNTCSQSGNPADLDFDGTVGSTDLAILLAAWSGTGPADLDNDGTVGSSDLAILLAAWG